MRQCFAILLIVPRVNFSINLNNEATHVSPLIYGGNIHHRYRRARRCQIANNSSPSAWLLNIPHPPFLLLLLLPSPFIDLPPPNKIEIFIYFI